MRAHFLDVVVSASLTARTSTDGEKSSQPPMNSVRFV
jgi:hypothetical protein